MTLSLHGQIAKLHPRSNILNKSLKITTLWDSPGGAVVKNPPANAGDTGPSPVLGRSHMPWSN